ncbi:alcohol dehydrogenase catalytic domain-containing protein [Pseudomonas sp. RIT-To-2]|uniref:alcohol dehydrogenase catalytic domain-containing protein n=1 Tax=Pseudomonas sp. RIT-To-2 TaxID=3462541 RepID=UPI002413BD4E
MITHPLAIVHQAAHVSLRERPLPMLHDGDLLVAPLLAGLCGTDLQVLRGERHDPAVVLGHEGVARIIACGQGAAAHWQPGQHVILNPTHPHDPSLLLGHLQDGLFQQRLRVPAAMVEAGLVVPLPVDLPAPLAALIEPLASVIHGLQLMARHKRPGPLLVYGDGTIGHLVARCARTLLGADSPVLLIHNSLSGLRWSQQHALAETCCVLRDDPGLDARLRDCGATAALLATPRNATLRCLEHALDYLASDAVIDLLGGVPAASHLPALPEVEDLAGVRALNCGGQPLEGAFVHTRDRWRRTRVLFGHRGVATRHLMDSCAWLARQPGLFMPLVTHHVPLEAAARLMQQIANGHGRHLDGRRFIKVAMTINPCPAVLRATLLEPSPCSP